MLCLVKIVQKLYVVDQAFTGLDHLMSVVIVIDLNNCPISCLVTLIMI